MKTFIVFLCIIYSSCVYATTADSELILLSNKVTDAVVNKKVNIIMKFVHKNGIYFIDNKLSHNEVNSLLNTSDSSLYKELFVGNESVKHYFETAKNIKIKVSKRGNKSALVSFESSNYPPEKWKECCFIRIRGKWYFDGIFSCD